MLVNTHRCRFVKYSPKAINAMAVFQSSFPAHSLLACVRSDGTIEIYNTLTWLLERTIPSTEAHSHIESVVWLKSTTPRLFTAGLNGLLVEWDLLTLAPKAEIESCGGAIWCMHSITPDEIAIGCEDGSIRIFTVSESGIYLKHAFDKQDAYHPKLPLIAAGFSDSCIRIYSTETGRQVSRQTLDTKARDHTLVWTLAYTPSGYLVSGDSLGKISFWDHNHTLLKSMTPHHADVLCLAVNEDTVYSSGVDRQVIEFKLAEVAGKKSVWVQGQTKKYHSNDVRALVMINTKPMDCLVSGGVDTIFTVLSEVSQFPQCKIFRHSTFPQKSVISVARIGKLVLGRFEKSIKLWQLGEFLDSARENEVIQDGDRREVYTSHSLLAELKLNCYSNLISTEISPCGSFLAASDLMSTRLYHFNLLQLPHHISKVTDFPENIPGSTSILFTPDSKRIILAGRDSIVRVLNISTANRIEFMGEISLFKTKTNESEEVVSAPVEFENIISSPISSSRELIYNMAVSSDIQWLAVSDLACRIQIFNMDTLTHHVSLPHFSSPTTCMRFHVASSVLILALASNDIYMYDAEEKRFSDWSRIYSHRVPGYFKRRMDVVYGIETTQKSPEKVILWSSAYFCVINLDLPLERKVVKRKNRDIVEKSAGSGAEEEEEVPIIEGDNEEIIMKTNDEAFLVKYNLGPTMFFGFLQNGTDAVSVERPLLSVMQGIPKGFYRKKFGQ